MLLDQRSKHLQQVAIEPSLSVSRPPTHPIFASQPTSLRNQPISQSANQSATHSPVSLPANCVCSQDEGRVAYRRYA